MEIFLNPNLVYVLLVLGFVLLFTALATPGTGFVELAALFVLLLAGWGVVYNQALVNWWALPILLGAVILFVFSVRKPRQFIFLALSLVALVFGSAYLFRGQAWWQPAVNPFLALGVSLLAGGYMWLVMRKALEALARRPTHNLDNLINQVGEAKTAIDAEGTVQVGGQLWSARSTAPIPAGVPVRVVAREGFILVVEQVGA
jgi:membrane-bound serine protease (ClpP class)